jgi:cation transport protein ChaC
MERSGLIDCDAPANLIAPLLQEIEGENVTDGQRATDDLWVFGYGSLMWRPGFPYEECHRAELLGFHRALCVYSYVHRGTPDRPGLVLGLDRGGACTGMAFRVAAAGAEAVIAYLRAREQATLVYEESRVKVTLEDGREIEALTYVVDRDHEQYAGRLPTEELLRLIRQGVGQSGENPEYVIATAAHLQEMGVADPLLDGLSRALTGQEANDGSDRPRP